MFSNIKSRYCPQIYIFTYKLKKKKIRRLNSIKIVYILYEHKGIFTFFFYLGIIIIIIIIIIILGGFTNYYSYIRPTELKANSFPLILFCMIDNRLTKLIDYTEFIKSDNWKIAHPDALAYFNNMYQIPADYIIGGIIFFIFIHTLTLICYILSIFFYIFIICLC